MEKTLPETIDVDAWRVRATAWEFMALSFRYPDAVLAETVATGEWLDAAQEIAEALGLDVPDEFGEGLAERELDAAVTNAPLSPDLEALGCEASASQASHSETLLHTLRVEATRLFVGAPEPVVSPYEGVHRAQVDGVQALLFVNPHSMEVERFMKACGLGRPEGTKEPLDHVATECELLEHLALRAAGVTFEDAVSLVGFLGGSAEVAYEAFLADHARTWMVGFAEAVAAETRESFYCNAAQMLKALVY